MKYALRVLALIYCLVLPNLAHAEVLSPDPVDLEDKLSQSVVSAMVQDQQGFIWIGTKDGLNRYDGYSIDTFYSRNTGLANDTISALETDAQGNVWIGTNNGLSVYHQLTGKITSYHHNPADPSSIADDAILALASDDEGAIWVGTLNGISRYQEKTQNFKTYPLLNPLEIRLHIEEVSSIYLAADDSIMIGTTDGKLAIKQASEDKFSEISVKTSTELGTIKKIVQKNDNQFWLLAEGELFLLDLIRQEIVAQNLTHFGMENNFKQVSTLLIDSDDNLWLGTEDNGLYQYQEKQQIHNQYLLERGQKDRIGKNKITALLEDASGVLWVGTEAYLNKVNPSIVNFNHLYEQKNLSESLAGDSSFAILVDSDDWLWVGSEYDGISVFEKNNGGYKRKLEISLGDWDGTTINAIVEGSSGRIWLLSSTSLLQYDKIKKQFVNDLEFDFSGATLLAAKYHQGNLWVASTEGLWQISENREVKQYRVEQKPFSHKNIIHDFVFDNQGVTLVNSQQRVTGIWLATEQGLIHFDREEQKFREIEELLQDPPVSIKNTIYDIQLDQQQKLLVATYGSGLVHIDFVRQESRIFNSNNSSLNNVIYSISQDKDGYVWLATRRGLYRMDLKNYSLSHFSLSKDQPISDFNLGAKAFDQKGNLFLGGINGVIYFNPLDYEEDTHLARPAITEILINNKTLGIGNSSDDNSKLPVNISEEITLHYHDISMAIEFTGLHFSSPSENRFRYKLEGYDKDWIEADANSRRAVYAKLAPGIYHFRLLAANKDCLWNSQEKSLQINVLPSPFLSGWAIFIYSLVAMSVLMSISYLLATRVREKKVSEEKLRESQERLQLSLRGSGDELWDWDIKSGALYLSNEWESDFPRDSIRSGYSEANSNIHPNDLAYVKQALNAHLAGKSENYECTYRINNEDGGWTWVLDQGKCVEFDKRIPVRMAGTLKNITELKNAEQQLSVIVKSFENISDGVWILDSDLVYIAVNKAFEKITGYTKERVLGSSMRENAIRDMTPNYYQTLMQELGVKSSWQGELEAIRSDGSVYPIEINIDVVRDNDGAVINYVGVFSDITFRKEAEHELRRLATTDQLTDLPNRNTFRKKVEQVLAESKTTDQHALLFIDLDNFKRINDSLGHGVGDELLINVAKILTDVQADNKGMVARLGGDEFIIFLQEVDAWNHPAKIAQTLMDKFAHTLVLSSNEVMVSPSIGIVMYPDNGLYAEELLRNADTAMYYAKKKGKNTYQFYTQQMNEQAKMRLTLENDLRTAIEKDEFVVFYQPKVSLATGKITSLEALVRWRDPKRGLVLPNEFIPLAEESGMIIPISQQVIEKSCIQLRDWKKRDLFDGKVAINLSAVQFYHENLWETVKSALHLANLEPQEIEFEITEGMVMQDLTHSVQQMDTLQEMGISLALDDFGVGYSSLGNLKDFPINTLKIDRSFVWDLDSSERDRKLVASIVTLAHNLDIKVVAEGVETVEQLEALREMNCEEIQGFIFSKPLPAWEIEKLFMDPNTSLEQTLAELAEDKP